MPEVARAAARLAGLLGCPALVTYKAKGVIADTDPRFVGIFTGGLAGRLVVRDQRGGDQVVAVKDLRVEVPGRVLLDDFTAVLRRNDFIALVGPNGAGKTTLFRLITGLDKPKSQILILQSALINKFLVFISL